MFDWLFEGRKEVYYVLGAIAVILVIFWYQVPRRAYLISLAVCLSLIGLYYLLDRLVITYREEVEGTVELMAASVAEHKLDRAFNHFAEQFRTPRNLSKQDLRALADRELKSGGVTSVTVWGFETPGPVDRSRKVTTTFSFKVQGAFGRDELFYRCEAVFAYEPPHGWQMQRCKFLEPHTDNPIDAPF